MSRENVEIVRSLSEPFTGVNIAAVDWDSEAIRETFEGVYSPEIELRTLQSGIGAGLDELYRGWDGLVRYLRDWLEPFDEYRVDWLDYVEAGDRVLVPNRQWGVGSRSGARVELELTWAYELQDGRITRIVQHDTLDEARGAAGPAGQAP